jgi:hypothetical protein
MRELIDTIYNMSIKNHDIYHQSKRKEKLEKFCIEIVIVKMSAH